MGGACSAYGGEERRIQGFGGETEGESHLRDPGVDERMDLQEVGSGGMDWIEMAENKTRGILD